MSVGTVDFTLGLVGETDYTQAVFSHEEVVATSVRHICTFCGKAGHPPFTRFFVESEGPIPNELLSVMSCFGCFKEALEKWNILIGSLAPQLRLYEPADAFLMTYAPRLGFPVEVPLKIK